MFYERTKLIKLTMMLATVVVLAGPALAAPPRKSPGGVTGMARLRPGWSNHRASRNIRHARDYSRDLYRYSRNTDKIESAVAKSESEELGRNIAKAQSELAVVRQKATHDKETINALKSINKHLNIAADRHKQLHEECCKTSVDGTICMKCCSDITLHLDRAIAEHAALLRSLDIKADKSNKKEPSALEKNE